MGTIKCTAKNKHLKQCQVSAVRGIISKGNKFLLLQRTPNTKHCPNCWEFVGGKTDGGNPRTALIREVKEETGLKARNLKPVKEAYDGPYLVKYYKVKTSGKMNLQKSEVSNARWFTRSQARKLNLVEHTRKILK